MNLNYKLVKYQDKLYYVYREVNENQIKKGKINDLRDYWKCDITLKNKSSNNNEILFLREIEDVEILEETEY